MATRPAEVEATPGAAELDLAPVVEALLAPEDGLTRLRLERRSLHVLPSRELLAQVVESLRAVIFPGYHGPSELTGESVHYHVGATLDRVSHVLQDQVRRGMCFACTREAPACASCEAQARAITSDFLGRLPEVRRRLATDVQAAYEGDPAATSPDEAIFCYPGIVALTSYRLAHELNQLEVPLLPRIITELAHSRTGIDIHPGARIGERCFIDHGTGVVIGETAVIGRNVRIYQGVTLGARSFPMDDQGHPIKGIPRHPIVEDDVIIYGGATVLGRIVIGKGCIIGGNVWLTRNMAPGSLVAQTRAQRSSFTAEASFAAGAGI